MTDDNKIPANPDSDLFGMGDATATIAGMTFTMSNNLLPAAPRPKIPDLTGEFEITGEITAYWTAPQLMAWHRAAAAAFENWALRIARPHMGRRQFRRLRGAMKANRRANWKPL